MNTTTPILLYALVAGLSPLALLATLAALGTGRGRATGSAFAVGFLLTQSVVLFVAVILGSAATPDRERSHETLAAVLELVLGIALLAFAAHGRLSDRPAERARESRTAALLARLGNLRPATALSVGSLLGVGGVKRLTITLFAGATIAVASFNRAQETALGVAYVAIASLLVWLPVAVYLVSGRRADAWTEATRGWLIANEQRLTEVSTVFFGVLLIAHSLVLLA